MTRTRKWYLKEYAKPLTEAEREKEKDARIALIKEAVERGAMQEVEAEIRIALIKEEEDKDKKKPNEALDYTWQR